MLLATEASLMVCPFQHLLDAVDFGRPLADQRRPITGQLSQLSLLSPRNVASPQEPVPQTLGDPGRILHVALAPGHHLQVLRVDHDQLEATFQEVVDRLPVRPRTLHRDVRAALLFEPGRQLSQRSRRRPKGP
jgi:hypothetical protein